jgi:predicted nucleic acid-binding protein
LAATENADPNLGIAPVYFDSALIAKFYVNEPGREQIREVARTAGLVVTSAVAAAEIAAAFHRKFREGAIDREVFDALNEQFQHDLNNGLWRMVSLTDALLQQVSVLFQRLEPSVFLRSLDAIHLVTAKAEHFDRVYSNDRHLLLACPGVGLEGVDPIGPAPASTPPIDPSIGSSARPSSRRRQSRPERTRRK